MTNTELIFVCVLFCLFSNLICYKRKFLLYLIRTRTPYATGVDRIRAQHFPAPSIGCWKLSSLNSQISFFKTSLWLFLLKLLEENWTILRTDFNHPTVITRNRHMPVSLIHIFTHQSCIINAPFNQHRRFVFPLLRSSFFRFRFLLSHLKNNIINTLRLKTHPFCH